MHALPSAVGDQHPTHPQNLAWAGCTRWRLASACTPRASMGRGALTRPVPRCGSRRRGSSRVSVWNPTDILENQNSPSCRMPRPKLDSLGLGRRNMWAPGREMHEPDEENPGPQQDLWWATVSQQKASDSFHSGSVPRICPTQNGSQSQDWRQEIK